MLRLCGSDQSEADNTEFFFLSFFNQSEELGMVCLDVYSVFLKNCSVKIVLSVITNLPSNANMAACFCF